MWWQQTLLGLVGLSAGFAVAGGLFALIIALGVVSRFAGKTHTAKYVFWYEDAIALGGILGNLVSVYEVTLPVGRIGAGIFGAFAGIFVGAWAMALTEIVNIIPIFTRRITLRRGMELIILSMALGRTLGALLFFAQRW
ncbi:MAG: stage V sporulation protein AB [Lachnospiraceae bacterium]|nr:stage V sporulation protein AB [Lachnospiraceae bacterium]